MIHDEMSYAIRETGCEYPVEWIEEGLHRSIERLHTRLQDALDASGDFDRILLGFGLCGNMLEGLQIRDFELIVPNVDDCISLMLYPHRHGKEPGIYYTTHGWLSTGKNAWDDYAGIVEKYGLKKADRIMEVMLSGYHGVHLIDTRAFDMEETLTLSLGAAEQLRLNHAVECGSVDWIKKLITGGWDDGFLRFGPNEVIDINLLELFA
jgi:hypothetical protein